MPEGPVFHIVQRAHWWERLFSLPLTYEMTMIGWVEGGVFRPITHGLTSWFRV